MSDEGSNEGGNVDVFRALSHKVRRAIVKTLARYGERSFTELMKDVGIDDSSIMAFHMRRLEGLVRRNKRGYYELTDLGWMAYKVLRELEVESLKDRAEEVIKGVRLGEGEVRPAEVGSTPQSVNSVITDAINSVKEALQSILVKGIIMADSVRIEKTVPVNPCVRIIAVGSDITLREVSGNSVTFKGTVKYEKDVIVASKGKETLIKVKGGDAEVYLPSGRLTSLEVSVIGGDIRGDNVGLPPNIKVSTKGGDVYLKGVISRLESVEASLKGGDLLISAKVDEVVSDASIRISALGGDASLSFEVPGNVKVVERDVRLLGGNVRLEVDDSLLEGSGERVLGLEIKLLGGNASVRIRPRSSEE